MIATIGFFDGVHQGHHYLLRNLTTLAQQRGCRSMVITFVEHPRRVLQKEYIPQLLTSNAEKEQLLKAAGVDEVIFLEFTVEFAKLSARQFMQLYLKDRYAVDTLLVGYDHHFGNNQQEGFEDYQRYGKESGIEVMLCEGFRVEKLSVSSTVVRNLLYAGDVAEAEKCLGRRYTLKGTVVEGRKVGRKLGFPTANLRVDTPFKLIPAGGVYAVWAEVEGKCYSAVLNIGNRPTLDNGQDMSIEVHLFDFDAQIYGASVTLHFVAHLREEQCFATLDDLKAQIKADCEMARIILFDNENTSQH
ncbi:MAG: bifunctional riboflavin kinase/FAD synthetase [Bacteroidaceae bacterium]|nr:bifunctional riboflavin kinase/FAD synthetase [Bacteroidaceae bacterium]